MKTLVSMKNSALIHRLAVGFAANLQLAAQATHDGVVTVQAIARLRSRLRGT